MKKIFNKIKGFFTNKYTCYILFWLYNAAYLVMIGFVAIEVSEHFTWREALPWNLAVMLYILILIPVAVMGLGLFTRLKKEPQKLMGLLFAVEVPVIFLSLIRLFAIRQMTGILWFLFLSLFLAMLGLVIFYLRQKTKNLYERIAIFLSQEIAVILGAYFFLICLFFLPIIMASFFHGLGEIPWDNFIDDLIRSKGLILFSMLLFSLLFLLTVGMLIITPLVAFIIYLKSFRNNQKLLTKNKFRYTKPLTYAFLAFYILISFLIAFRWHGNSYDSTIENYLSATSFEDQEEYAKKLIKHDRSIQADLLNKYLAKYRFLDDNSITIIEDGYTYELNLNEESASGLQALFNQIALPFIYQGNFEDDIQYSKERYRQLFDTSIQEGEREELIDAMKATNTEDELKAGILDEESETVRLVSQTIKANTANKGTLAKISIEEEYENTSDEMQEVYYEFSLPENAVITGLWLGPDLEYQGVIAPKGAARRTYEKQIRRRIDPALLEQTSPRQYRLRVFPIPIRPRNSIGSARFDERQSNDKNQKVKFEYVTFVPPEGKVLPQISKKRNLYKDRDSRIEYFINEDKKEKFKIPTNYCEAKPFSIETAVGKLSYTPLPYNSDRFNCHTLKLNSFPEVKGKKIAFLLDSSYSSQPKNWSNYLKKQLPIENLAQNNQIDAYFFTDKLSRPIELTPNRLNQKLSSPNFGQTDRFKVLQNLPQNYDLIIMFTDESESVIENNNSFTYPDSSPIYIFHENGFPQYPDELTSLVLKSGGGVFNNLEQIFEQIAHLNYVKTNQAKVFALLEANQYGYWVKHDLNYENLPGDLDDLIANKQAIDLLIKNNEELEKIHQIALNQKIVTPYSSYLALITERQEKQLEEESQKDNKFETDYDLGEENISDPDSNNALGLNATPEPEEWMLMITAVIIFGYFFRKEILGLAFYKR